MITKQFLKQFNAILNGELTYDNADSGLSAVTVKNAIDELQGLVSNLNGVELEVLAELPETGEENKIYLVDAEGGFLDEFIWKNGEFVEVGKAELNISNLATYGYVNTEIAKVDDKATQNTTDISTLQHKVSAVENDVDTNSTKIGSLELFTATTQAGLEEVQGKVSDLEGAKTQLESDIVDLDAKIDAVDVKIDTVDVKVDLVDAKVEEVKVEIEGVKGDVTANANEIVALKDADALLDARIDALENAPTPSTQKTLVFSKAIAVEDWSFDATEGLYACTVNHQIGSKQGNFDAQLGDNDYFVACEALNNNNTIIFSANADAITVRKSYQVTV